MLGSIDAHQSLHMFRDTPITEYTHHVALSQQARLWEHEAILDLRILIIN